MSRLAFRTCPLCEATCGLEITVEDDGTIGRIRGDRDDVFSKGFICPKGSTLKHLHEDPDRVRTPLVDGRPATWEEAFAEVEARLRPIIDAHGPDAVALYLGNPNAHTLAGTLYNRFLIKALRSRNIYSASTVDQRPKEIMTGLMFGTNLGHAVPDLDRTSYLLLLGANPFESNGSLATAPDWPGRLRAIRQRGGRLVVVDPKRTKTADEADEHIALRPGTDAHLLMGMVHVLFADGLVDLGSVAPHVNGVDEVASAALDFPPEAVAPVCGVPADVVRRLARELAAAPAAAVYGRIGTCTQEFGTLASWLVDVLNTLTGNLDRPGGAMFANPAVRVPGPAKPPGRWRSRVRGLPESVGELPVACLAEEIETPGEGQVRALITIGGNPVLSTPNSGRLDRALASLEFVLSIDVYVNETTRHGDVLLPAPSPLTKSHYDTGFYMFALRNVANYSEPVLPREPGALDEWEIVARLAVMLGADPSLLDTPPETMLDGLFAAGPYDLTVDDLRANPHGIDFGPLQPRVPEVLRTPAGKIELAPEVVIADVDRLRASLSSRQEGLVLIGRRHLRSNNSWMHNVGVLVKGKPRCTLQVHPEDAARLGLDGMARVSSRAGTVVAPVEVTDALLPGVVSLPHGWGHDMPGAAMAVAEAHAGVNSNVLTDEDMVDPISGNAVLNGIPVTVEPLL